MPKAYLRISEGKLETYFRKTAETICATSKMVGLFSLKAEKRIEKRKNNKKTKLKI